MAKNGPQAWRPAGSRTRLLGAACSVLLCAALVLAAPAGAWEIDFEDSFLDLDNPYVYGNQQGRVIDDEYTTPGRIDENDPTLTATFSAYKPYGSSTPLPAVLFDTNNPTGGDPDLGAPFYHGDTGQVANPGQVLILHEQSWACRNSSGSKVHIDSGQAVSCDDPDDIAARPAGRFEIEFNKAITLTSIDFFDVEHPESGPGPTNEILLFDVAGNQIMDDTPFYTPDTGGDNKWKEVVFNVVGVKKIELRMGGSGAIDNITGLSQTEPDQEPDAIPEPSALLVFGTGVLWALAIRRRRRYRS